MNFNKVCVIGLGYIGLPTAAVIASRGVSVVGLDVNPAVVDSVNRGETHIIESDLDAVVQAAVSDGHLRATLIAEPADAFVVAVPTPFKDGHVPDLRYIQAASIAIAPVLRPGNLVILESTSPVGATEAMAGWLAAERPDLTFPMTHGEDSDVRIAHCPERVLPGNVLRELVRNDRVIGGLTDRCAKSAIALYRIFSEGDCMVTDARTAEMCKLTENSFRDVNIAFANELSLVCDELDLDVWNLIRLANRHPRVNILQPGPGVGGHCIAVDPWFIVDSAPKTARLIRTAREVNDSKPRSVVAKVREASRRVQSSKDGVIPVTIACFGLAFKPDIDDLRESPAVDICAALAGIGDHTVLAIEPHIGSLPPSLAEIVTLVSVDEAVKRADILVFLVNHRQFKTMAVAALTEKVIVDACGFLRVDAV